MSLRLRLTLWYSGLLAATLLVLGVSLYLIINWRTYDDLRAQLKSQSEQLGVTATIVYNNIPLEIGFDRTSRVENKNMYIQLVNYYFEGRIFRSQNLGDLDVFIPYPQQSNTLKEGFVDTELEVGGKKYKMMTYQRPIPYKGEIIGLLQVGIIPYNEQQYLSGLRNMFIFSSLFVLVIAFTVGMLIARQALRPIGRVIEATQNIENGADLSVRIPESGPKDEIGTLVTTLNSMLGKLEKAYNELDEAYKAQRRFVSDASHELRTPLTTIRGNIDLLEKMWSQAGDQGRISGSGHELVLNNEHWKMSNEAMSDIAAEARRMSRLVGDLLALARADAGYMMDKKPLELLPLTEEAARKAQLLPRTAEWKVGDLSALQGATVYGSRDYLQQLLFIFIENAFKYTPSGYVELSAVRKGGHVGWVIRDTGIGMNPNEIPHIFDRFYRADESRGVTVGTGLGLSIAKWILDEHRGSVEVITRIDEGSAFTIWLPLDFPQEDDSSIMEGTDREE